MDKHTNRFLILLLAVFVIVGFFVLLNKDKASKFVKNVLEIGRGSLLIDTIQKEISTPGALVAKIESSKAFLTKTGVFAFTNRERTNNSLPLFTADSTLDLIAKDRLNDMFIKGYFEHVSPSGESASTLADDYKYEYIAIGENIALGNFENDNILVDAWMASPGHRANILNSRFTLLGVAVGKGLYNGRSTWIGVQIFARPLSLCTKLDESLKNKIDRETAEIDVLGKQIGVIEAELEALAKNKQHNREEYNKKVDEYNTLANNINFKINVLKADIAKYNEAVRAFNVCISSG